MCSVQTIESHCCKLDYSIVLTTPSLEQAASLLTVLPLTHLKPFLMSLEHM
jgi:hypothetical protein